MEIHFGKRGKTMNKMIGLIAGLLLVVPLHAQTWKSSLEGVSNTSATKTIRIKPGWKITIGNAFPDTCQIHGNRYFSGSFLGGNTDSIKMSLDQVKVTRYLPGKISEVTTMPAAAFLSASMPSDREFSMALVDIHNLTIERPRYEYMEIFELGMIASVLVAVVSPLFCIDYAEGTFNAERYQYWALGSAIGLVATISYAVVTGSGKKSYQLKPNWPIKKAKVWKFK